MITDLVLWLAVSSGPPVIGIALALTSRTMTCALLGKEPS